MKYIKLYLIALSFLSISCTQSSFEVADVVKSSGLGRMFSLNTIDIRVSNNSDRSNSQLLNGQSLPENGKYYIFISESSSIKKAQFYLNGDLVKTENIAPYDMAGTLKDDSAYPLDVSKLKEGKNIVTVRINSDSNTDTVAAFNYGLNPQIRILHSNNSDRSNQQLLNGMSLKSTDSHYIFISHQDISIEQVKFYLNGELSQTENQAPYDMGGTATNDNSIAIDNSKLKEGSNTLKVYATGDVNINETVEFSLAPDRVISSVPSEQEPVVTTTSETDSGSNSTSILLHSNNSSRSSATSLSGMNLDINNKHYVFVKDDGSIEKVVFKLNNGAHQQTENMAPYDLAGTNSDDTAVALNSSDLIAGGTNTVEALVYYKDGTSKDLKVNFSVNASQTTASNDSTQEPTTSSSEPVNQDVSVSVGDVKISSVSGSLSHNAKLSIKGSGFLNTKIEKTLLYDERDNGPQIMSLKDGQDFPDDSNKYGWKPNETTWKQPLKIGFNSEIRGNNKYYYYCHGNGCYVGWPKQLGGGSPPESQRKLFVSWYFKHGIDLNNGGGSCKFLRAWDDTNGLGTRISWTQMHMTYPSLTTDGGVNWGSYKGSQSQWNRMDMQIDADKNIIKNWTNGQLTHEVNDFKKRDTYADTCCGTNPTRVKGESYSKGLNVALLGYDVGGNYNKDAFNNALLAFGEIMVHRTPARVEICDSANFDSCQHREIQIVDGISDSEIQLTINKGSYSSLSGRYLHLIGTDNKSIGSIALP